MLRVFSPRHRSQSPSTPPVANAHKEHSRFPETKRTARSTLRLALELADKALDGLPIYGPKAAVSGVSFLLKANGTADSNAETLQRLEEHVRQFRSEVLDPLSELNEANVPPGLGDDVQKLATELQKLLEQSSKMGQRNKLLRFVTASEDEGDLRKLEEDIKRAFQQFQTVRTVDQGLRVFDIQERQLDERNDRLIDKLPFAKDASFDSINRTRQIESCFQGTRSDVLEKIRAWIGSEDANKGRIFWLNGVAGLGKTTIARSVAEWARSPDIGILGAAFFFDRDVQELQNAALLFPTLAYQLAQFDPQYKRKLADVLSKEPDLGRREFATQFKRLIQEPLKASHTSSQATAKTILIVLDAVDECSSKENVKGFLRILLTETGTIPQKFLVFITSRPEAHIRLAFKPRINSVQHAGIVLHDIEESVVQRDIEAYLRAGFSRIHEEDLEGTLPKDWPEGKDFKQLLEDCGRFFVYAATALRFIGDDRCNPTKQLRMLLTGKNRQATTVNPYSTLDQVYLDVLRAAISLNMGKEDVAHIRLVLGTIVVLQNPLPLTDFANLMEITEGDVLEALRHLHSIIVFPTNDSINMSPRFFHPSFPDFITDKNRCTDERFQVDAELDEARMCIRCLDVMKSSLKRDLLNLAGRSPRAIPKEELSTMVGQAFSPLLRYACEFWAEHMRHIVFSFEVRATEALGDFIGTPRHNQDYLFYWLEAMSWLGLTETASDCLKHARHAIYRPRVGENADDIDKDAFDLDVLDISSSVLDDALEYNIYNQFLFAQNPLEVYGSALAFNTTCSWLDGLHNVDGVRVIRGGDYNWKRFIALLPHVDEVTYIAYSHDERKIATGTSVGLVTIWDAESGARKLSIETNRHAYGIRCIQFSRDDALIVSTNAKDPNIFVWDALSGTGEMSFVGHRDVVNALAFKVTSPILASASQDTYIRVWDMDSGKCLLKVQVQDPVSSMAVPVTSINFDPTGDRMISTSNDMTIRLWNSLDGTQIWRYQHSSHINANSILVHGGRIVFCDEKSEIYITSASTGSHVTPPTKLLDYDGRKILALFLETQGNKPIMVVATEEYGIQRLEFGSKEFLENVGSKEFYENIGYPLFPIKHIAYSHEHTAISGPIEGGCALWEPVFYDMYRKQRHATSLVHQKRRRDFSRMSERSCRELSDCIEPFHEGEVTSMLFSDDGRWLATGGGSEDGKVLIFDAAGGEIVCDSDFYEAHKSAVRLLSFSPDSRLLASASDDGIVCVWTIDTERTRAKLFFCKNQAAYSRYRLPEETFWSNGCYLQRFGPHDTDIAGAKLFFSDDGTKVSLRTSFEETSRPAACNDGEKSRWQPKSSPASLEMVIQEQEHSHFTFISLGRVPSRNMLWFVRFEGGGQRREIPIPLPDILVDGPIAYCRDHLALSLKDGTILLLDVSQVIPGINLPNYFSNQITHIPPASDA